METEWDYSGRKERDGPVASEDVFAQTDATEDITT